jgi:hypothetical protein
VTSTVKHIYNIYSCFRVVQCSVYISRGLILRHRSGLAPMRPMTGTECAVCLRDERSVRWQHRVDVVRCSANWLLASAQCVAQCRAPVGGGLWQADGSQRV